jgi:hypothetical protein
MDSATARPHSTPASYAFDALFPEVQSPHAPSPDAPSNRNRVPDISSTVLPVVTGFSGYAYDHLNAVHQSLTSVYHFLPASLEYQ